MSEDTTGLEEFELPEGAGTVRLGCLVPEQVTRVLAPYPRSSDFLLDDKDIERLMKSPNRRRERKANARWMLNQGRIGQCNCSAGIGAIYRIRSKSGQAHVPLASEWLYCAINGGQDQGSMLHDARKALLLTGVPERSLFPQGVYQYPRGKGQSPELLADASRFRIHEAFALPEDYDDYVRAVASAIALEFPIVMAWHVSDASMRLQNGYVTVGKGRGNHASFLNDGTFVGGEDIIHPDLVNSWGPSKDAVYGGTQGGWGDGGYGKITMENLFRTRAYHEHYVITGCVLDTHSGLL